MSLGNSGSRRLRSLAKADRTSNRPQRGAPRGSADIIECRNSRGHQPTRIPVIVHRVSVINVEVVSDGSRLLERTPGQCEMYNDAAMSLHIDNDRYAEGWIRKVARSRSARSLMSLATFPVNPAVRTRCIILAIDDTTDIVCAAFDCRSAEARTWASRNELLEARRE